MSNMLLYHTSSDNAIDTEDSYKLSKIMETCINLRIFIVGYNVLNVANGSDKVLIALLCKNEEVASLFEKKTHIKIVRVEKSDE